MNSGFDSHNLRGKPENTIQLYLEKKSAELSFSFTAFLSAAIQGFSEKNISVGRVD